MEKYFDGFGSREDVAREFECGTGGNYNYQLRGYEPFHPHENFPTDAEIIYAAYGTEEAYSGSAFVVFERDGVLYEVHGGHCSCHGLEGQWEPEETTWAALRKGNRVNSDWGYSAYTKAAQAGWQAVLDQYAPVTATAE